MQLYPSRHYIKPPAWPYKPKAFYTSSPDDYLVHSQEQVETLTWFRSKPQTLPSFLCAALTAEMVPRF